MMPPRFRTLSTGLISPPDIVNVAESREQLIKTLVKFMLQTRNILCLHSAFRIAVQFSAPCWWIYL